MKKRISTILSILVVLLVAIFGIQFVLGIGMFESDTDKEREQQEKQLLKDNKTEVIVYGEKIEFGEGYHVRNIDKITADNLKSEGSFVNTFLIVNDLNYSIILEEEDLQIISDSISDNQLNFLYCGKDDVKALKNAGITIQNYYGEMYIGVIFEKGMRTEVACAWGANAYDLEMDKRTELLAEAISKEIVNKIEWDNR